jgi:hypothetical protein
MGGMPRRTVNFRNNNNGPSLKRSENAKLQKAIY